MTAYANPENQEPDKPFRLPPTYYGRPLKNPTTEALLRRVRP